MSHHPSDTWHSFGIKSMHSQDVIAMQTLIKKIYPLCTDLYSFPICSFLGQCWGLSQHAAGSWRTAGKHHEEMSSPSRGLHRRTDSYSHVSNTPDVSLQCQRKPHTRGEKLQTRQDCEIEHSHSYCSSEVLCFVYWTTTPKQGFCTIY